MNGTIILALIAIGSVLTWVWATSLLLVVWAPKRETPMGIRRLAAIRPQGGPAEISRLQSALTVGLLAVGPLAMAADLARGQPSTIERLILQLALTVIVGWSVALVWIATRSNGAPSL